MNIFMHWCHHGGGVLDNTTTTYAETNEYGIISVSSYGNILSYWWHLCIISTTSFRQQLDRGSCSRWTKSQHSWKPDMRIASDSWTDSNRVYLRPAHPASSLRQHRDRFSTYGTVRTTEVKRNRCRCIRSGRLPNQRYDQTSMFHIRSNTKKKRF